MNESSMTLLTDLSHLDIVGWEVSPKYHGCRAYWDGKQFWTRGGKVIKAPDWFTANLPDCHLDGEIYAGIGKFEMARLAVQYGRFTPECVFMVFDAPQVWGSWRERMFTVSHSPCGNFKPVPFGKMVSVEHLRALLADTVAGGGEGLVLRNPCCLKYEVGRTVHTVRIKTLAQIDRLEGKAA